MPKARPGSTTLKRQQAGSYATPDGRFSVEQASGGWMVTDVERTNELGLPLVRGPFSTLDEARAAIETARVDPPPASALAARIAALPPRDAPHRRPATRRSASDRTSRPAPSPEPPVVVREWRRGDGDGLRRLWTAVDMRSIGDDDEGLATMARRNPGLVLVATAGDEIVGSALGGWDGRRGWIYHVATAPGRRRSGIARQLVARVEAGLRAAGCRKVNVTVADGNGDAMAFWRSAGYTGTVLHHLGRELRPEDGEAT